MKIIPGGSLLNFLIKLDTFENENNIARMSFEIKDNRI